jgi:hypothetical protein
MAVAAASACAASAQPSPSSLRPHIPLLLGSSATPTWALIDTGAAISLLTGAAFRKAQAAGAVVRQVSSASNVVSADKMPIATLGSFVLNARILDHTFQATWTVVPTLASNAILGMNIIMAEGLTFQPQEPFVSFLPRPVLLPWTTAAVRPVLPMHIAPGRAVLASVCAFDSVSNLSL